MLATSAAPDLAGAGAQAPIWHALRAACDAVLIGVGTVLADNPYLTVRAVPGRSPARVVLDSCLRTPLTAAVLNPDAPTYLMTNSHGYQGKLRLLAARHIAIRHVRAGPGGLDIAAVLRQLYAEGIRSVVVEGGPRVLASLLESNAADRVIISISPQIHGQRAGAPDELPAWCSAHALRLNDRSIHLVGDQIIVAADVRTFASRGRS